jgi:hypothetical protein
MSELRESTKVSQYANVVPMDYRDQALLRLAQESLLTRAILPSGLKVPDAPEGMDWIVRGAKIILVPTPDHFKTARLAKSKGKESERKGMDVHIKN